jgi:transposase
MTTAPEVRHALDLIRDIYVVEHEGRQLGVARTAEHRTMRQARSKPIMEALKTWLAEQRDTCPPKSPLGSAIGYSLHNWTPLTRFLDDEKLPPDNNASEAALRVVALGRKNYLFVGNEDAGTNVAGLYSLVATCEENGVNPSTTSATCSCASRITRPPTSTTCCPTPGGPGPGATSGAVRLRSCRTSPV